MERVLLLGANGQVGFELRRALAPLGALTLATRGGDLAPGMACEAVDLAAAGSVGATLERVRPTLIVNAAAYTAVDRAEQEPALAERVNGAAVGEMGAWAATHDAKVLHFSTDYVFAGDATVPYSEADATAPLGAYGRSKLAGERSLIASGAEHLIVRTAWVYAARGKNFLRTMLRLAGERDELRVVGDQIGSPTPATLIAQASALMLGRWLVLDAAAREQRSGVYHLTSSGQASWSEFASAIVDGAQRLGLLACAPRVSAITTAAYPTPAQRPAWSVLDCARLEAGFALRMPHWRDGLAATLLDMKESTAC